MPESYVRRLAFSKEEHRQRQMERNRESSDRTVPGTAASMLSLRQIELDLGFRNHSAILGQNAGAFQHML